VSEQPRRRIPLWTIPATLLGLVVIGLPLTQLTDTGVERSLKDRLGLTSPTCEAQTADSAGWGVGVTLPDKRDEPRAVSLDGQIYLAGGISEILEFGEPSDVPGVEEHVEVESLRAFTRFDPRSGTYTELAPLPEPLNHIGLATYGGDIYLVAGHGNVLEGAEPKDLFYRYSPAQDRWTRLPSLPTPRGAIAVGVVGDRLYVAGGLAAGTPLATVEAYDFGDGRWHRVADLPGPREHAGHAVHDGRFYVVGGRNRRTDALHDMTRYDPATDSWEAVAGLPVPTGGLEALTFDGAILALGGGNDRGGTVTGAVQRYDADADTWTQLAEMRTPRHGFGAAAVGGTIYTFGGSPCALFAATDIVEEFAPRRGAN
jgi:N-acetylneuraminic acid mutarotase